MIPIIAETGYEFLKEPKFNTLNIYLDARPSSDLAWESLDSEVATALKLGAKLSFELDFGFSEDNALFQDPTSFFSRGIAISSFEERVYKLYKSDIVAIILYRGSGDFKKSICRDASLYGDFLEWKGEFFGEAEVTEQIFRIFSMELFMQYLHRLAAPLIDQIPLVALFNLQTITRPSYQAELLSKVFFPYIIPGVRAAAVNFNGFGWEGNGNLGYVGHKSMVISESNSCGFGVVIPKIGQVPYDLFDKIVNLLSEKGIVYQLISESLMIDSWHGLDYILVFSESLTEEGRRMLQGFNAAGGQVVSVGKLLDLTDEIDFEKFIRSRGI